MNHFDLALRQMLKLQGEWITYFQGEKHKEIKGIFKRSMKLVDTETNSEIYFEDQPNIKISLTDLLPFRPSQEDRVSRENGESYNVNRIDFDSQNGAKLILEKRNA